MDDIQKIFSDFKAKVDEIAAHSEHVHSIHFKAALKNGTSFNFTYNAEKFAKQKNPKGAFKSYSIFNGIVDIVATLTGIAILVYCILSMLSSNGILPLAVLTYALFIVTFICSALFHFFSVEQKAHLIFSYLKESSKIITLAVMNLFLAHLLDPLSLSMVRSYTLVIIALAFLFLSGRTKLSLQVSLAITALLPFVSLIVQVSLDSILRVLLFSLWSVATLVFKHDSRMKTNAAFAFMGMLSLSTSIAPLL